MNEFARALRDNPAPTALGDVRLRYAPSMLIGQTPVGPRTWRPVGLATVGIVLVAASVAMVAASWSLGSAGTVLLLGGLSLGGSVHLRRVERRRRAFVVNFGTTSLRLDFVSPIAGHPQTLIVLFDAVQAVTVLEQGDGARCLTVDFTVGEALLREVLVAQVPASDLDALWRLARVLEGAFGLGSIPPNSPYLETQGEGGPSAEVATRAPDEAPVQPPTKPE